MCLRTYIVIEDNIFRVFPAECMERPEKVWERSE